MMTRRGFLVGSCAAVCAGASQGCRSVVRRDIDPAVEAELRAQMRDGLFAGAVCGVVGGSRFAAGKLRWTPAEAPIRLDALFDLASVGKTFTASLCALLYAEGRLDPDAPFTEYMP